DVLEGDARDMHVCVDQAWKGGQARTVDHAARSFRAPGRGAVPLGNRPYALDRAVSNSNYRRTVNSVGSPVDDLVCLEPGDAARALPSHGLIDSLIAVVYKQPLRSAAPRICLIKNIPTTAAQTASAILARRR